MKKRYKIFFVFILLLIPGLTSVPDESYLYFGIAFILSLTAIFIQDLVKVNIKIPSFVFYAPLLISFILLTLEDFLNIDPFLFDLISIIFSGFIIYFSYYYFKIILNFIFRLKNKIKNTH